MCEGKQSKNCSRETCKTMSALARLEQAEAKQKSGYGIWAYNSCFIAQLMAQKDEGPSQFRLNRKNPDPALRAYKQVQKIIKSELDEPLAVST